MDAAIALRQARQYAGLSQRQLAELAGVHRSTVGVYEAGRDCPPGRLVQLLRVCGLELDDVRGDWPRVDRAALTQHLLASTTQRLWAAMGLPGDARNGPFPPWWGSCGGWFTEPPETYPVLQGEHAVSIWLPERCAPPLTADTLLPPEGPLPGPAPGLVPVAVGAGKRVRVGGPLALSLLDEHADDAPELIEVSRMLAGADCRDAGGRRPPPHRTPQSDLETVNLMRTLDYALHRRSELPSSLDDRGHRLGQPVSLSQWLVEHQMPPRRGSSRRSA